jgi:hypothetical protein
VASVWATPHWVFMCRFRGRGVRMRHTL